MEEFEPKNQMVLGLCVSPGCPTWAQCVEDGGSRVPAIVISSCKEEESGRICLRYPFPDKTNPHHDHYPTRGSEKEQSGTREQAMSKK